MYSINSVISPSLAQQNREISVRLPASQLLTFFECADRTLNECWALFHLCSRLCYGKQNAHSALVPECNRLTVFRERYFLMKCKCWSLHRWWSPRYVRTFTRGERGG